MDNKKIEQIIKEISEIYDFYKDRYYKALYDAELELANEALEELAQKLSISKEMAKLLITDLFTEEDE